MRKHHAPWQFGGVASCHLDYDLAPFVKKSFKKHFHAYLTDVREMTDEGADAFCKMLEQKYGEISVGNTSFYDEDPTTVDMSIRPIELDGVRSTATLAHKFALKQLEREGKQSAQAMYHNLNTLESRAGSQVPFSSINFGTDTSVEGRLVTKWLLEASIDGIGAYNRTSIFPIGVFKYKKGVNDKPGTPNYDLRLLAQKSLSKRIYPNIVNCNFSGNVEEPGNPDTEMATMGWQLSSSKTA